MYQTERAFSEALCEESMIHPLTQPSPHRGEGKGEGKIAERGKKNVEKNFGFSLCGDLNYFLNVITRVSPTGPWCDRY
jgi:hypothetical protein